MTSINEFLPFIRPERNSVSSSIYTTDNFLSGDIISLINEFQAENEREHSFFTAAPYVKPDAIFDVTRTYDADAFPQKVNLGPGTYRDENGDPWVLPSVRMAKEKIKSCGHEYLPIAGLDAFRDGAVNLIFHDLEISKERIATCQSISGTGSLLLAGLVFRHISQAARSVYITSPTLSNHRLLFETMGFTVKDIPYLQKDSFDFFAFISALVAAEEGSLVILHTCAHNPTGCDPSRDQWMEIASIIKQRRLFPVFDSAYLGFISGSVDEDKWAINYFTQEMEMEAAVCLSFAKNMGLYGERVGLVAFVVKNPTLAVNVQSVLENCQRATVSGPPAYGARIASEVLHDPVIREQWETPGDWSCLVEQTGMFGYTGLNAAQVRYLADEYHVYMADNGRICIAGLNEGNVEYFARTLDCAVRYINSDEDRSNLDALAERW
ncbi:putative aspartate aminotransferase [Venturia nashicola]|uniref:Aspartate aminotransferase n=1 Tax=Venturia nashicola TaxID=86259 RepID=A0A4Z1P6F6_9PEZI|nr:putative aspartate aminotransferase [Venturia nashicola]